MQKKLTLRLDDHLIEEAKIYAKVAGKSLSQVVAEYLAAITSANRPTHELTSKVARLKGSLKGTKAEASDYDAYLEEKHK